MKLSDDSFALFLLCSHLGLPDESDVKPLSAREWNELEQKLATASLNSSILLGSSVEQMAGVFQIDKEKAERFVRLLDRRDAIEQDLDRLKELGIWVITRLDENFPQRLTH